jgi:hypothetical protein
MSADLWLRPPGSKNAHAINRARDGVWAEFTTCGLLRTGGERWRVKRDTDPQCPRCASLWEATNAA